MKATKADTAQGPALLIDAGNSSTKFALCQGDKLLKRGEMPTSRALTVEEWPVAAENVTLCSVVPAVTRRLRHLFGPSIAEVRHDQPLGIGIDYPDPASIGPDRLANAVAAAALYGAPAIVVDFGTAVTFDVLDGRGFYVGGVIAPGLGVFTDYLAERTALLPRVTLQEPDRAIGKSTDEAMRSGAVLGYRGLITEIIEKISRELDSKKAPLIIATGGHAALIAERLPLIQHVDADLTLQGIRLAGERIRLA